MACEAATEGGQFHNNMLRHRAGLPVRSRSLTGALHGVQFKLEQLDGKKCTIRQKSRKKAAPTDTRVDLNDGGACVLEDVGSAECRQYLNAFYSTTTAKWSLGALCPVRVYLHAPLCPVVPSLLTNSEMHRETLCTTAECDRCAYI